jgi:hypothetical protein
LDGAAKQIAKVENEIGRTITPQAEPDAEIKE